jgi:hypothetical protein
MRSKLSKKINGAFPYLSWDLWSARRTLDQAIHPERSSLPPAKTTQSRGQEFSVLFVIPQDEHGADRWLPGIGNYPFELFESAKEALGPNRVHQVLVPHDEPAREWHDRVITAARESGATHIFGRTDHEPNGLDHLWSWDVFVKRLRRDWPGVFLALSYDSAYPYVSMHLDRLTRLHDRTMPVVLDRPISEAIRPHRPAAGPLFLPLSTASMQVLDAAIAEVQPQYDLTFIGNVSGYPYRADLLAELKDAGLDVVVNPQSGGTDNRPGFESYARALKTSRITLNFSRCNGEPITQLKTRLLEGSLFGAVVASDSPLYVQDYFVDGEEFISYSSPADLKKKISLLLGNDSALVEMRSKARRKANQLRVTNLWQKVDQALEARGLARLPLE